MQKTDLNVSPYYDDFDTNDNFQRVLFRPGTVQARELNNSSINSSKSSRKTW